MILTKPCILARANHSAGYSCYFVNVNGIRKQIYRHREALEKAIGRPIQPGLMACHHCDIPNCIEPEHLYEGDNSSNIQDAYNRKRRPGWTHNLKKTHCPKGHPYDEENTYWRPDYRGRDCKTCRQLAEQRRRNAS